MIILNTLTDLNLTSLIAVYGPMAAMLVWFGFRMEKLIKSMTSEIRLLSMAILRRVSEGDPAAADELLQSFEKMSGNR